MSVKNREIFDEGLGTVYERFMLNNYFDKLTTTYPIKNVLEIPIYGMTGLTGINSVHLAIKGCKLMLLDTREENVSEAEKLLEVLPIKNSCDVKLHKDLSNLPFGNDSFDLVWNFAAIWHVENAGLLLDEMARVSSNLVLIFIPNRKQIGYALRKYVFDKEFFYTIDESWINLKRIADHLKNKGMKVVDEGLIDIPFWPDTAIPVKSVFKKIFKKKNGNGKKPDKKVVSQVWNWDIMNYYMGNDPGLEEKMKKLSFLERMSVPKQFKAFWAHHLYILCSKN